MYVQKLNFPNYNFRLKNSENKLLIFDEIRKKFVSLQPEEWVRQHCIKFLIEEKKIPKSLINVEKSLEVNGLTKRYDIVVFKPDGSIFLLVECKEPKVNISQETFDQIARYNLSLNSQYLMITNGIEHYCCLIDFKNKSYRFLKEIPKFMA